MSLFGGLLGGSSKTPPPITQTNEVQLSKQQKKLVNPAVNTLAKFAENTPQLPGITPLNATQIQAQQQALGTVPAINTLASGAAGANNFLTNPDILTPGSNPALQGWIDASLRPLDERFSNVVLPGIRSEQIANSGLGGSRQALAETGAARDYLRQAGDTTASIANQGYAQGLGALIQGTNLVPQTQGAQTAGANVTGAVGQQNYDVSNQARSNDITNTWLPFITAQDILGSANAIPGGGKAVTTVTGAPTTKSAGPLQGALGGAIAGSTFGPWGTAIGGGLGALASLFG